ncbi:hypothetical protein M8C21_014434, partial [Ambrosia artemisiifolia]
RWQRTVISKKPFRRSHALNNTEYHLPHQNSSSRKKNMATKDSITKNVVVASDHSPVTKEEGVETEATINNVIVSDNNSPSNEKEDVTMMKKVVASDNTKDDDDNEKETGSDLGVIMDKLNLLGLKKKLVVLPINGFLVHRAFRYRPSTIPKNRQPDFCSGNFMSEYIILALLIFYERIIRLFSGVFGPCLDMAIARRFNDFWEVKRDKWVYKRPFCDEFLKFCFERFEVGIWSSAMEHNIGAVLNNVMGELKSKLLFTWDQNQCTKTDFKCLDNKDKPVFLKELDHLWSQKYSINLPWCDGEYSPSNTLLITDPVKALLNPPNTSISPGNYDPDNKEDDVLGPNGEMRVFLEGLAEAKDVQSYVKAHPIGDPAITSSHADWDYYSKIIQRKNPLITESFRSRGRFRKKTMIASSDPISKEKDDEKETGCDLGVSMGKLNLGPKKKLLVLPLGGFLVHRAHRRRPNTIPKNRSPDFSSGNFMIYKRPFCQEFLKFCFERFEVGIWSTAMEHNISGVLTNVMGEHKSKLLFTWDQNQCTDTCFTYPDNPNKPLFVKELKHIWKKKYIYGPWSEGDYSAANTLLITYPVKALLNPPNTSIYPGDYDPENSEDDILGPNSELRAFLDGLVEAEDVQSYVKAHPIGDPPITSSHPDWDYYSKIIRAFVLQVQDLKLLSINLIVKIALPLICFNLNREEQADVRDWDIYRSKEKHGGSFNFIEFVVASDDSPVSKEDDAEKDAGKKNVVVVSDDSCVYKEEDAGTMNAVVVSDDSRINKEDVGTMNAVVASDDSCVSKEDDAEKDEGTKNVVVVSDICVNKEEDAGTMNAVVVSDSCVNKEEDAGTMNAVVVSDDSRINKEDLGTMNVVVASDDSCVSKEDDAEKDAGTKNVVVVSEICVNKEEDAGTMNAAVVYDDNIVSKEGDAVKDAGTKNDVVFSDHSTVSKEDVETDAGTENVVVASDHSPVSKENDVETEAAINNVVASDNSGTSEKEDTEDDMMKKVVASDNTEDEDNEKETGSGLSSLMGKLNLGPKTKLLEEIYRCTDVVSAMGQAEMETNVEVLGPNVVRRSLRVRKVPEKLKDYHVGM